MNVFSKCPKCGYDLDPVFNKAITVAKQHHEVMDEQSRQQFWDNYFKEWDSFRISKDRKQRFER